MNHVSVTSLSLMLLFKNKSFFKANLCTKLLPGNFWFPKVHWGYLEERGAGLDRCIQQQWAATTVESQVEGLGLGLFPHPQYRAESTDVCCVGSRWCAAEELEYLVSVRKPNRLPDKRKHLKKEASCNASQIEFIFIAPMYILKPSFWGGS